MNPLSIILTLLALAGTVFLLYLMYGAENLKKKSE
jgi:hypothetical protein